LLSINIETIVFPKLVTFICWLGWIKNWIPSHSSHKISMEQVLSQSEKIFNCFQPMIRKIRWKIRVLFVHFNSKRISVHIFGSQRNYLIGFSIISSQISSYRRINWGSWFSRGISNKLVMQNHSHKLYKTLAYCQQSMQK